MILRDVILLIFSFLFAVIGGYVAANSKSVDEANLGIGCLGFFVVAFLTFTFFAWRKQKFKKQRIDNSSQDIIAGGKKFHSEKSSLYTIAILLFSLGGFLAYFLKYDISFTIVYIAVSLIGLIYYLGLLFGFLAKEYLIFEFDGVRFGYRSYSYTIRWDNIRKISTKNWQGKSTFLITLLNPEDITRYLFMKRAGQRIAQIKKIYSQMDLNLKTANAHFLIQPERFGFDSRIFHRLLETYLKFPERRLELKNTK